MKTASKRRGAATVEFALAAPVLVLLLLGLLETGRLINANQAVLNASREGARRGAVNGVTISQVTTLVRDCLTASGYPGSAATVNVSTTSEAITVSVTLANQHFSLIPLRTVGLNAQATTVMRREATSL